MPFFFSTCRCIAPARPPPPPLNASAALQGFIFMSLDPDRLTDGIFDGPENSVVSCEIYDGELTPEHLLNHETAFAKPKPSARPENGRRRIEPHLDFYFTSTPLFEAGSERNLPLIALVCWLTLGFLLFGITWTEVKARGRAEQLAANLRESETALEARKGAARRHIIFHRGRCCHDRRRRPYFFAQQDGGATDRLAPG